MTSSKISFEFFPPKTEAGAEKLWDVARQLAVFKPQFISVTCGAGGSAIEGTFAVAKHLRETLGLDVAPHIAHARLSRTRLHEVFGHYKKLGIKQVVAIRGDIAAGAETIPPDDLYVDTIELVADLHNNFALDPIVSAYPDVHPLAQSPQQDMDWLKRKQDIGATRAITQFFFEADTYLRFRDKARAAGISLALIPGIMPMHDLPQILRFARGCGALVPEGFETQFVDGTKDPQRYFDQAVAHTLALCTRLRQEGIDTFHVYALNRAEMAGAICKQLG